MRACVTGATGFIGSHLVAKLIQRGYSATCLVRDRSNAERLAAIGATLVEGDVTDRGSLRAGMRDAEVVFHLAGWYAVGRPDKARMHAINVQGAQNRLEVAAESSVSRIIHTSTVGVFGNTRGHIVDESYCVEKSALHSEYERTKWIAHYEVARRLQRQGVPLIIVQPRAVTGPGDRSPHMQVIDQFFARIPMMFGARSGLTLAHVEDVAEGLVLAAERGAPGETYILCGPALTYRRLFEMSEEITGLPAPRIWAPGWMAGALSGLIGAMARVGIHGALSAEALDLLNDYTYWASADKAKREIGFSVRPLEVLLREVLAYEIKERRR